MAKKAKTDTTNKAAAIRDYLKQNPGTGPTAIASALTSQGFPMKAGYVSVVTAKMKASKAKKKAAKAASRFTATTATLPPAPVATPSNSKALDALLVLYKAANGHGVGRIAVQDAFITALDALV